MLWKIVLPLTVLLGVTEAHTAVSTTGRCGASFRGVTCHGSSFGHCCSSKSWCGSPSEYCGTGCQSAYGLCSSPESYKPVSKNGRCGAEYKGQTCQGSPFGGCCSKHGYCGSSDDYCAAKNCQAGYGSCSGHGSALSPSSSSRHPTTLSSIVVSSQPAGTCSAKTITLAANTITVTAPAHTTTLSVPAQETTKTVTSVVTLPAEQETTTVIVSGNDFTTISTLEHTTTVVEQITATQTEERTVTEQLTITQSVEHTTTEQLTTIQTVEQTTTEQLTTTVTIPGEEVTRTSMLEQTATLTVTATPGAKCISRPLINGGFETGMTGWATEDIVYNPGRNALVRYQLPDGNFVMRARSLGADGNGSVRMFQTLQVCAGQKYRLKFSLMRVTTVGDIQVNAIVWCPGYNPGLLMGAVAASTTEFEVHTSNTWTAARDIKDGDAIVFIDFTFRNGVGVTKEVLLDNVSMDLV